MTTAQWNGTHFMVLHSSLRSCWITDFVNKENFRILWLDKHLYGTTQTCAQTYLNLDKNGRKFPDTLPCIKLGVSMVDLAQLKTKSWINCRWLKKELVQDGLDF